jgi:hypothetical protein
MSNATLREAKKREEEEKKKRRREDSPSLCSYILLVNLEI